LKADFNRRQRPSADGRPACRMNSASRGLWPVVGLRRPGKAPFASAEADAWRAAPEEADFNRRQGLRPVVGLRRPGKRFCFGAERLRRRRPTRSLRRDAWRGAPEEADFNRRQGLRPAGRHARRMNSASGGLRPTVGLRRPGKRSLRRRRPTPGAQRLERPISIGTKAFGR
jgi:hypothetical protein